MESADKRKIIIIVSSAAFLLLGVIVVFATLPGSGKDEDELSVRVQDDREVTVEDMMKSGDGKSEEQTGIIQEPTPPAGSAGTVGTGTLPQTSDEVVEDNAEVRELQRQLRANRNTRNMDGYSESTTSGTGEYAYVPATPKSSRQRHAVPSAREEFPAYPDEETKPAPTPTAAPPKEQAKSQGRRFFSSSAKRNNTDNAIAAVVHGDQTVKVGSTLKMHLLQDMSVNGTVIPKNSFVYGVVSFAGERMTVKVSSIRLSNSIYPVNLDVYDRDGILGIYVPGNIKAEAKGDMTEAGVSEVTPTGTGIIGSATRAVISAGKSVLSKKVRTKKATVRTNYKIYLQWGKD